MRITNIAVSALLAASLAPGVAFATTTTADPVEAQTAADSAVVESVVAPDADDEKVATTIEVVEVKPAEEIVVSELTAEDEAAPEKGDEGVAADGVEAFVQRLYELVLGRAADEAGLAVQVEGVKTMGAGQVALNFFNSEEFQNMALTNEQRVEIAYEVMLGRPSDESGKAMWVSYLDNGMSVSSVVVGFAESPEFTALCEKWGVEPGNVAGLRSQLEVRDQNPNVTAFVSRLYQLVLGRADVEAFELNFQCQALLNGLPASQLAMNFFNADEFAAKGLAPEQQVKLAYQAILDREPDEEGLAYWTAGFDYQMTIENVVAGFANSDEFKNNCAKWGVNPGSVDVQNARNKSQEITRAIYETYELAFDRIPDPEGLDTWCEVCATKGLIWVCEGFLQSEEVAAKATTNQEKVEMTYRICLGREGDEDGVAGWTAYLDKGNSLYALLARFCEAEEYVNRCSDLEIPAGSLVYYSVSANHQLNLMITNIIENVTGRNAYQCYLYVSTFTYKSRGLWPSYDGWMEDYAINFILDGGGNCYGYASLFAYLARACGYDTNVYQGRTTAARGGTTPHGWCEVYVNGQTLVVDPDLYHELGTHCYMLPYGSTPLTLYR